MTNSTSGSLAKTGARRCTSSRGRSFLRAIAVCTALALGFGACGESSSDEAFPGSIGTISTTEPPVETTTTTAPFITSTTDLDAEGEPTGVPIQTHATVVASGPGEPVSFSYQSLAPQSWILDVGSVWVQPEVFVSDGRDAIALVAVEVTLDYTGESKSGQVLDLVFDLETVDGVVSAVHSPCRPTPAGSIDVFRSVKPEEPVSALMCFATDSEPVALLITPFIEEQVRVPLG